MRNCKKLCISPKASIKSAIEAIDKGEIQIALIVDNQKLIGVITDGDIRRSILAGKTIKDSIEGIYNSSPETGHVNQSKIDLIQHAFSHGIKQLPIINDAGEILGIEYIPDCLYTPKKNNPVVLMAGGLGTRLRPLTTEVPKPMLTVGNKPILETILESFIRCGFENFYMSVNYKAEKIQKYFGDGTRYNASIKYIEESRRLGTAGALSLLPSDINESLIVMNGDLLTDINFEHLLNFHQMTQGSATMCVRKYQSQIPYGIVQTEGATIKEIREKPVQSYFVNAGIYVLEPQTLEVIPKNSFYDMPQLYQTLIKNKHKVCSFPIQGYWMDIGQPNDFEQANLEYDDTFNF